MKLSSLFPHSLRLLVLQQDYKAPQALSGQCRALNDGLADFHGERVDEVGLHDHPNRQLAHHHVGGGLVIGQRRLQALTTPRKQRAEGKPR